MRIPAPHPGYRNPLSVHVHPWPTRYHGPLYTRPVFGMPYRQQPAWVFKPDDFHEFYQQKPQAGLGDLLFDTNNGIFGEKNRGMFKAGYGALGATDCQTQAGSQAQSFCQANANSLSVLNYGSVDECVSDMTNQYASSCLSAVIQTETGGGATSLPWGTYSAQTATYQNQINAALKSSGYCPITADGKLGPKTCGAAKAVGISTPSSCKSFTNPSTGPCAGGGSVAARATTPSASRAMLTTYSGGTNWSKYLLFGLGAAAVLGAAYYMDKRSKRK